MLGSKLFDIPSYVISFEQSVLDRVFDHNFQAVSVYSLQKNICCGLCQGEYIWAVLCENRA